MGWVRPVAVPNRNGNISVQHSQPQHVLEVPTGAGTRTPPCVAAEAARSRCADLWEACGAIRAVFPRTPCAEIRVFRPLGPHELPSEFWDAKHKHWYLGSNIRFYITSHQCTRERRARRADARRSGKEPHKKRQKKKKKKKETSERIFFPLQKKNGFFPLPSVIEAARFGLESRTDIHTHVHTKVRLHDVHLYHHGTYTQDFDVLRYTIRFYVLCQNAPRSRAFGAARQMASTRAAQRWRRRRQGGSHRIEKKTDRFGFVLRLRTFVFFAGFDAAFRRGARRGTGDAINIF